MRERNNTLSPGLNRSATAGMRTEHAKDDIETESHDEIVTVSLTAADVRWLSVTSAAQKAFFSNMSSGGNAGLSAREIIQPSDEKNSKKESQCRWRKNAVRAESNSKTGISHDAEREKMTIPAIMPIAAGKAGTYDRGAFKD